MKLDNAITNRRSIRRFKPDKVSKENITAILDAGNKAPSAKNIQQWRFHVYTGEAKEKLTDYCLIEFDKIATDPEVNQYARTSLEIMNDAPVSILVFNANLMSHPSKPDVQSVSAAIQNMLLKAYDLGLGSLWICDILYIEKQVLEYVKTEMQLVAAVSIGYANHSPRDIRKLTVDDVTTWYD